VVPPMFTGEFALRALRRSTSRRAVDTRRAEWVDGC